MLTDMKDFMECWGKVLLMIEPELGSFTFRSYIKEAKPVDLRGNTLYVETKNEFLKSRFDTYASVIEEAIYEVLNERYKIESFVANARPLPISHTEPVANKPYWGRPFSPHMTFDSFVPGPGNDIAYAMCKDIAKNEKKDIPNPVFIYSGSGMGKTHLIHAIGNEIKKIEPWRHMLYVTTEDFVNEFVQASLRNAFDQVREKYKDLSLLMIDDIQFIEHKEMTQNHFFYIFNNLIETGCQIVLTSDKPPRRLSTLDERLRSRFSNGSVIDINLPPYEIRYAILLKRKEDYHHNFMPDEILQYIAQNVETNVRELEGAYNTVLSYARLNLDIDLETTKMAMKNYISTPSRDFTLETIFQMVATHFHLDMDKLLNKTKIPPYPKARHVFMYITKEKLNFSAIQIAKFLGVNHTTVLSGSKKIEKTMHQDPEIEDALDVFKKVLRF